MLENDSIKSKLNKNLIAARKKHPNFEPNIDRAIVALTSEVGEVATARLKEGPERVEQEVYDVMTICMRILLREFNGG